MYSIIHINYTSDDHIDYIGYGIRDNDSDLLINDITTDKKKLEELVDTMNRLQVSPIHVRDIIEDFLI